MSVTVGVIARVVCFCCGPMMQGVVDVFVYCRKTDALRQEGARHHPDDADAETDQLWWNQALFTDHEFDDKPGNNAAENRE